MSSRSSNDCVGTEQSRLRWITASLEPLFTRLREQNVEAVAICLLHSYVNPIARARAARPLLAELPELSITLSHEIAREWREYERASSATLERVYRASGRAAISARLERELGELNVSSPLHVMQSNGGITTRARARGEDRSRPCSRARSAARWAARHSLSSTGRRNLLCIDMGGTSFDLSLVVDGEPTVSTETELEGLPVLMPLVDIHTIGAGGGIARLARGRRTARRAAERRRRPRAGLLRPRRHPADRHRRQPLSRSARLRATSSAAG